MRLRIARPRTTTNDNVHYRWQRRIDHVLFFRGNDDHVSPAIEEGPDGLQNTSEQYPYIVKNLKELSIGS